MQRKEIRSVNELIQQRGEVQTERSSSIWRLSSEMWESLWRWFQAGGGIINWEHKGDREQVFRKGVRPDEGGEPKCAAV